MKKPKRNKPVKKVKKAKKKQTWRNRALKRIPNDVALVNDD